MFYCFYRCWPQFNQSFDFHRFDSVPAKQLPDELNRYALEWLQENRDEVRRQRDKRFAPKRLKAIWRKQLAAAVPPSPLQRHVGGNDCV